MPGTEIPGPAVNERGEGLGKSQQEDVTESRSRVMQQFVVKPLRRHVADPAAQEPSTTLRTLIPQGRKDRTGQNPARSESFSCTHSDCRSTDRP